jgi:cytochrome c551/c552
MEKEVKRFCVALFICAPLFSSCLNVDTGELIFKIKSSSDALTGVADDASFDNTEATYKNVSKLIFQKKCLFCHSSQRTELGVNLSQYSKVFGFSDFFTPIVVKGEPEESGLYIEVQSGRMPPKKSLSPQEIAFLKKWIQEGAIE